MNITIICVGKIKEKYLKDALIEYTKRISRYCKINIIELQDEKTIENASLRQSAIIKEKEGQRILKNTKQGSYVIALELRGKMLSSEEMSSFIDDLEVKGKSSITFIIGGSLGLSEDVLKRADYKLCFSKMTFPHQLMRVILLEQIYRWFKISSGEPYHK